MTSSEASYLPWAANFAAGKLATDEATLSGRFPNFTPAQLLQAAAAAYNFGTRNISGNPATIDQGSTHHNYRSNVLGPMLCVKG